MAYNFFFLFEKWHIIQNQKVGTKSGAQKESLALLDCIFRAGNCKKCRASDNHVGYVHLSVLSNDETAGSHFNLK